MLVLAPATCCLGGIAADQILTTFCKSIRPEEGSGGWAGIIKTWLDGPEAQTQDAAPVEAKPAVSTSSAGAGKRPKGSSRVCPTVTDVQVDRADGCRSLLCQVTDHATLAVTIKPCLQQRFAATADL